MESQKQASYSFDFDAFPEDGVKHASIVEWENGDGFTVALGSDDIELTNQECTVLEILFAQTRLLK